LDVRFGFAFYRLLPWNAFFNARFQCPFQINIPALLFDMENATRTENALGRRSCNRPIFLPYPFDMEKAQGKGTNKTHNIATDGKTQSQNAH
jgi:hypothetical protein